MSTQQRTKTLNFESAFIEDSLLTNVLTATMRMIANYRLKAAVITVISIALHIYAGVGRSMFCGDIAAK